MDTPISGVTGAFTPYGINNAIAALTPYTPVYPNESQAKTQRSKTLAPEDSLIDESKEAELENLEKTQLNKGPAAGSASFNSKPLVSMATQVKRVNTMGGKVQGVMPQKYKNCHMRIDRLASNVYG